MAFYCNGKNGICDCYPICKNDCEHFDNSGGKHINTNADRIRAMSDDELVDWAKIQIGCGFGFFPCGVVCDGKCESYDDETCKSKIMEWLKQPVEE